MADVDLSVVVAESGVTAAINKINALREAGLQTSQGMNQLAKATSQAMTTVTNKTADSTKSIANYDKGLKSTEADSRSLAKALQQLEAEYSKIATLAPKANAAQRLTISGGGDINKGLANAAVIAQGRAAAGADPVADRNAYLAEQNRLLAENAARTDAMGTRNAAQSNLARAQYDQANQGLTAVERATLAVTRAQKDYQKAVQDSATASANLSRKSTPAQIQAQTAALNSQAAALRQVTNAEIALADANETANKSSSAFASSFSYFIIAGAAQKAASAIIGAGEAAITASATMERSFADVNRTFDGTGTELASLKAKLIDLSTTTPISFTDLSTIAALGNQLGIAKENIQGFTTTISQYSAISGQSADDAATAFGQISNLTGLAASQYGNLASAIEYVARTSVATEGTIQNTSKEITALASGAGFSAQAIVGLAGTLSSLAIPPERARGALSLYFGALNSAVAEGGPKLDAFATLTGKSAAEITKLVEANKGQDVFTSFIAGLSKLNTVAKTTALDELGLSTIRVDQTMRALSQNVPLLTSTLAGADSAFASNTELARQYAIIQDTLASKITEFQNAIQNATAAVGDQFAPALSDLLSMATKIVVEFSQFSQTPFGETLIKTAGYVALLVAAIASLIAVLALARAGMIVFNFAMEGLGWTSATTGFRGLIASLISTDAATRASALSMTGLGTAIKTTTISAAGLRTAASGAFGLVVGVAAIVAVVAAVSDLGHQINYADDAAKALGASTDDLSAAMKADNPGLFASRLKDGGDAATAAGTGVGDLNDAVQSSVTAQIAAQDAIKGTNSALDGQTVKVGAATKEWLKNAVLQSDAMKNLLKATGDSIAGSGPSGAKTLNAALASGLDLDKFSDTAYKKGKAAALKVYDGWLAELQDSAARGNKGAQKALDQMAGGFDLRSAFLSPIADGIDQAKTEGLVAASIMGTVGDAAGDAAPAVDSLGNAIDAVGQAAVASGDGFIGAVSGLTAYQDAIQSGLSSFTSFSSVLQKVTDAAGDNKGAINAGTFSKGLKDANTQAVTFFNGIGTLAASGRTSFATQLAALGPDASGILAGALKLNGPAQAELETNARFAAFLASDAFKKALSTNMADSNEAYGRIFSTTGNLGDVQAYIAAQVAGTGKAWEAAWDAQHPEAKLNVDLIAPTDADLKILNEQMSGQLTVEAQVIPTFDRKGGPQTGSVAGNKYTDTKTGASIVLPATLDGAALTASLTAWQAQENASPEQIATEVNKPGLSASLDAWTKTNGPVTVYANVLPTPSSIAKLNAIVSGVGAGKPGRVAAGGEIGRNAPRFAAGGQVGYGQFAGPGTGTSDSMLARVSTGEYLNTSDSRAFWGADFFDSLNRKMLPTSFLNMLGTAASAGNGGPSHVANVNVHQYNPLTKDPLKELRNASEMVSAGIWGSDS